MNCEQCKEIIAAQTYGETDSAVPKDFSAHLESCIFCRDYQGFVENMAKNRVSLPIPQDDSFWIRQKTSIIEKISRPQRVPAFSRWVFVPSLALVALVSIWISRVRTGENIYIAQDMEFLQNLDMVEQLDLIEELDVLDQA